MNRTGRWRKESLQASQLNDLYGDLSYVGYYDYSAPPKLLVENCYVRVGERADFITKEMHLQNDTLFYYKEPSYFDVSEVRIYKR